MQDDPYAILGVQKTASAEEIKKAYRKLARTSHPDINPDDPAAEARFVKISAAYDLLKDPETRRRFDAGEIDASGQEKRDRNFYRDHAGNREGFSYRTTRDFEDFGDPADIFAEMFRQRSRGSSNGAGSSRFAMPGQDMRYTMDVTFLEAARGATRKITLPEGGTLDVRIPQGLADGQTLRLKGKGGPGSGGAPSGDAYITVTVRPHHVFRREDNDIVMTLPITIDEAILGGKVKTPTLDGAVNLTIPAGATTGQTLRLKGKGIEPKGKPRGDQRVELKIVAPPQVDDELKSFMENWRGSHGYDPRKGMM
ncbi:J domain-containing protein [Pseudohoeflea suaedae]|uniref:J domain-containing protein n=1 Tax=Pseudohoeflea suaedae TaxID=877384 RepID=A0A4R5PJT9_9HYPH|nr:J domain-containing protein [Pseudohoeflea suaedae]TDH35950.1 J domain-containing protein [Pseudohoeflea suaedae]